MSLPTPSLKQRAHELIDQLPDDATLADMAEALSLVEDIEAGLADSDADRIISNNVVRRRFGLPALPE